jgi:hypothetical protein
LRVGPSLSGSVILGSVTLGFGGTSFFSGIRNDTTALPSVYFSSYYYLSSFYFLILSMNPNFFGFSFVGS